MWFDSTMGFTVLPCFTPYPWIFFGGSKSFIRTQSHSQQQFVHGTRLDTCRKLKPRLGGNKSLCSWCTDADRRQGIWIKLHMFWGMGRCDEVWRLWCSNFHCLFGSLPALLADVFSIWRDESCCSGIHWTDLSPLEMIEVFGMRICKTKLHLGNWHGTWFYFMQNPA